MQLVLIATFIGLAAAAFQPSYNDQSNRPQAAYERNARIIAYNSDVNENSYRYNYETENGIKAEEQGQEAEGIEAQGGFQYTGDDGNVYSVSYTAGKDGFQPQAAHLPAAPPTPEAILKALAQNAADEAAGIFDDGQYIPGKYDGAGSAQQQFPRPQAGFRQPYKF
ncbi:unnamed protein product [Parnassius apollo]|uniref:(apollo) hypothetical protein n=1 Tax=Parnassius apollo TaxID=110799 RepID=A0A8S3XBE3_PARAO|nr:unnamed protein product [Parnassius apollo]